MKINNNTAKAIEFLQGIKEDSRKIDKAAKIVCSFFNQPNTVFNYLNRFCEKFKSLSSDKESIRNALSLMAQAAAKRNNLGLKKNKENMANTLVDILEDCIHPALEFLSNAMYPLGQTVSGLRFTINDARSTVDSIVKTLGGPKILEPIGRIRQ